MVRGKRETLSSLSSQERLETYNLLLQGATHIWTKNKLQEDKALEVLKTLVPLTQKDPYFLAHLTSYIIRNSRSKDLKVFTTYINSLSSANGERFSPKSKYFKPNLRYISAAAVQQLDPKLACRVLELAKLKYSIAGTLNKARHFPRALRTALKKYIRYREANIEMVRGIKKAGLSKTFQNIYRSLHLAPSDEAAAILRWQQKEKKIDFEKPEIDFKGLSDLEIGKTIRKKRLPVLGALGALAQARKKVSPVIAVALLERTTGNQAVILRKTFEDAGVLKDKEVMKLYEEKISEAQTALDRVKTISKDASDEVKKVMKKARAKKRKEATIGIGKIFLHLDMSPSMEPAIEVAKSKGTIIAESVNNPKKNFQWGYFNDQGELFPLPKIFEEDAFKAILFGRVCDGMTDAFQLYPTAREFGAKVDTFISDGCHNTGNLESKIRRFHENNPKVTKPKAMLWVFVKSGGRGYIESEINTIKEAYEANDIPVATLLPEALENSALVNEAIQSAMLGPIAKMDTIMKTELLELPSWYEAI